MKSIDKYFNQMEQLLRKMIVEGEIDEYDDGEVMISIHQFEEDKDKIAQIISRNPDLEEFYNNPKPIQVVEKSEKGLETFSEDMSIRILSEYIQEHQEFEYKTTENTPFSEYITDRFRNIAKEIRSRLNKGLRIPYLNQNEDNSKRTALGYIYYDDFKDNFSLLTENKEPEKMDIYDVMPLVFNYIYQRKKLEHCKRENNKRGINNIPLGYRGPVIYREDSTRIKEDTDFSR